MIFNVVVPTFSIIAVLTICAAIALCLSNRLIDRLADKLIESGKYGLKRRRATRKPMS